MIHSELRSLEVYVVIGLPSVLRPLTALAMVFSPMLKAHAGPILKLHLQHRWDPPLGELGKRKHDGTCSLFSLKRLTTFYLFKVTSVGYVRSFCFLVTASYVLLIGAENWHITSEENFCNVIVVPVSMILQILLIFEYTDVITIIDNIVDDQLLTGCVCYRDLIVRRI